CHLLLRSLRFSQVLINLCQPIVAVGGVRIQAHTGFGFLARLFPPLHPSIHSPNLAMRRGIFGQKSCRGVQSAENLIRMRLVLGAVVSSEKQGSAVVLELAIRRMAVTIPAELRKGCGRGSRSLIQLNLSQIFECGLRFGSYFRSMHENPA